jgi:hypothetical protein
MLARPRRRAAKWWTAESGREAATRPPARNASDEAPQRAWIVTGLVLGFGFGPLHWVIERRWPDRRSGEVLPSNDRPPFED